VENVLLVFLTPEVRSVPHANDSHVSNIAYKMHLYFPPLHLIP